MKSRIHKCKITSPAITKQRYLIGFCNLSYKINRLVYVSIYKMTYCQTLVICRWCSPICGKNIKSLVKQVSYNTYFRQEIKDIMSIYESIDYKYGRSLPPPVLTYQITFFFGISR